jgi:hypothetical protein
MFPCGDGGSIPVINDLAVLGQLTCCHNGFASSKSSCLAESWVRTDTLRFRISCMFCVAPIRSRRLGVERTMMKRGTITSPSMDK